MSGGSNFVFCRDCYFFGEIYLSSFRSENVHYAVHVRTYCHVKVRPKKWVKSALLYIDSVRHQITTVTMLDIDCKFSLVRERLPSII